MDAITFAVQGRKRGINMADIELVIKIPEEQYRTLNAKSQNDVITAIDEALLIKAVKNGTPLPKGHGRLIDADAVEKEMNKSEVEADRNADYYTADKIDCAMEYIINAETIIEADKAESEE